MLFRSVVFVSHNLSAVQSLCQRAILLEKGLVIADGATADVLQVYLHRGREGPTSRRTWEPAEAPQNGALRLLGVSVEPVDGDLLAPIDVTRAFRISVDYQRIKDRIGMIAVMLVNEAGVLVFDLSNPALEPGPAGVYRESCIVPGDLLNAGEYRISVTVSDENEHRMEIQDVVAFDLMDSDRDRRGWYGKWEGVLRPSLQWSCERTGGAS